MARDIEDTYFSAIEALGNYFWSRAWDVADRVFKFASWLLLIGALFALDARHPRVELKQFAHGLTVLWFAAVLVSIFDALA